MSQHEIVINKDQIHKIPKYFISNAMRFKKQMLVYECAVREITTKLEILDTELGHLTRRNPISSIKSRVKQPDSIIQKLIKEGHPLTVESLENNLSDVAGVRVICSYIDDIYQLYDMLKSQDDIEILEIKDYINYPKDNGYRSLHVIVKIPVFLSTGKHYSKVEIQIRTIAMDFWASLEHEIRYKKNIGSVETISQDLLNCANTIAETDQKMLDIRNSINKLNGDQEQ